MGFSNKIKEKAMVASARHCCVCHRYRGINMEVHHIKQRADGGEDIFENAIPLCYDCHSDAGHYNERHPKGIKFSSSELKKSRDEWYNTVKERAIPSKKNISKDIQSIYYVFSSFDILQKILEQDFSTINKYRNQVYLRENQISDHWKEIIKSQKFPVEQIKTIQLNQFLSIEEYKKEYSNATLINKIEEEYPYYEAKRNMRWEELLKIEYLSDFFKILKATGISEERCCISLLHKNVDSCAGETPNFGYTEYLQIFPISFGALGITNVSDEPIKLNKIITTKKEIKMPNFLLNKKEMVLIPTFALIGTENIGNMGLRLSNIFGDRGQALSRIFNDNECDNQKMDYLGDKIECLGINYNNNEGEYEIEIHEFDYNNLYVVNAYWMCGSCPHLFFIKKDGFQEYSHELLKSSSNKKGEDKFQVPCDVYKIIIRELEDEITYLDKVYINNKLYLKEIVLKKGESIFIDVDPFDIIKIEGHYEPLFSKIESKLNDMWQRNNLIKESNRIFNKKKC